MSLFHQETKENAFSQEDIEKLLKDYEQDIADIVDAILASSDDADLDLSELVEHMPFQARIAVVEKIREMVAKRNEEKAKQLQQQLDRMRQMERDAKQKGLFQRVMMHLMSQETLRKMRESFLARPGLEGAVQNIGQELAKKGVLQNMQLMNKGELGDLHHGVNQAAGKGKDAGRGFG